MKNPTLEEEKDPQAELNRTLHPSPNDEILLAYVEDLTEQNTIWINTKTSSSIEFHLDSLFSYSGQHEFGSSGFSVDCQV